MAGTTRSAAPVFQALTVGDRVFGGMDTYTDPNKLEEGVCQRITNLVSQNGSLVPRKGFQCQTTTARSGSYWASIPVRSSKNNSSSAVLVAESNGSLDAGFWKFDSVHNDAVPIPMSASGTLTFSNIEPDRVRLAQFGRYVYAAPGAAASGTDSYPLRIDTNTKSQKLTSVVLGADKFVLAGHGLAVGDPFVISAVTSGTLPGALSVGTVYFVTRVISSSEFRVSTTLPTTTTTSVSHLTWTAPSPTCQVTIVTTFKGETLPLAVGLPEIAPIAEGFPFVAKAIPTSNVYNLVSSSVTIGGGSWTPSTSQMLSNPTFTGTDNTAPASPPWDQFVSSGTKTVTVKTASPPNASVGNKILIDDNGDSGIFPGVKQDVSLLQETTTLYNGSISATCLMYKFQVRMIHYDNPTTPRRRPVTLRVKGLKYSGSSYVEITGCLVEETFNLLPTTNADGWTVVDILADFRDFKDELAYAASNGGKIRVEIQAASDFGVTGGSYAQYGLYVDYAYLYPHAAVAQTVSDDASVDQETKLVRVRARTINTGNTDTYAGYVRDRHFYYNVTSSITTAALVSGSNTVLTYSSGTMPENGTPISFSTVTNTDLVSNKTYFVISATSTTFSISETYNGTARTIVATGTPTLTGTLGLFLKNTEFVSAQYYLNPSYETQAPTFSIGIQSGTSTSILWGGRGAVDVVGRYITFDLNAFAKSELENVKAVYIRCNDDFFVNATDNASSVVHSSILFYIGQLVYNGELQNQGTYEYAFTRWKAAPAYVDNGALTQLQFNATAPWTFNSATTANTYFGGVESPLSKTSVPLKTSDAISRIKLLVSASDFKDAAGAGYTHLLLYRRNNTTFPDGKFRCVAQINISGTTPALSSSSANIKLDSSTTATNIVLIDNIGDTELLFDKPIGQTGYVYRDGKDFFPQACETVAVHQQRLWMSKNNTVFASWLLDIDNEYATHTTIVPVATDPYIPVKGASFDISSQNDYEPIVAMVPFSGEGLSKSNSTSNALLILRNNSYLPVIGSDASNFSVLGMVREPGTGCIAPLCAQTVLGRVWWMSNSGINQYNEGLPVPVSKPLDRIVNARASNPLYIPVSGNLTINQSLQRTSSSVLFDGKFIFTSAQPGGTYVSTLFVFDPVVNAWFEWSFPQPSSGAATQPRSMYVFNSDFDSPELFVAASNGHIYKYAGSQDIHISTPESFNWTLLTRQYGQTYSQGQAYYAQNRVSQLDIHLESTANLTANWRIYNQNQPQLVSPTFNNASYTFYASGTWAFGTGNKSVAIRNIMKDMRGTSYSVQLSGSSLADGNWFRIYGILLHVSEGGIKRIS